MKALHQRVNIVPILAKADTLTPPEVEHKKHKVREAGGGRGAGGLLENGVPRAVGPSCVSQIREEIEHFGIKVYQFPDCDSDEDEDFKLQDQVLKVGPPWGTPFPTCFEQKREAEFYVRVGYWGGKGPRFPRVKQRRRRYSRKEQVRMGLLTGTPTSFQESIPFAVIGSNTVVEARGRRVRGRLYPWGIVEGKAPSL